MLGLWPYAYDYDDPYVAGLTSFLCFAFCFLLMLTCEPGLNGAWLNVNKCFVMYMDNVESNQDYLLNGSELQSVVQESDLGVIMSQHCKRKLQIEIVVGKENRMIAWVLRNIVSRSKTVLIPIYKSLIRPYLENCAQVWSPSLRRGNWGQIMNIESCS